MTILCTNDDGIGAPGLHAVEEILRRGGKRRVVTVAPAFPASGTSRAITITKPVRVEKVGEDRWALDGTPADCVLWAVKHLLRESGCEAVVSGVNHGPNLGTDVVFSGTCAAALEGARFGVPSLAVSLAVEHPHDFSHAAAFVAEAVPRLIASRPPRGVCISANVPGGVPRGVRVGRPGRRAYSDFVLEREDPFGRSYYWLAGDGMLGGDAEEGTDLAWVQEGYISVTPLDSDFHAPYTDLSPWETT